MVAPGGYFKSRLPILVRDELDDVGGRGGGGRFGGGAPFLVERAFADILALARDAELSAVGTEHHPDDA